ncbi:bifunctional folylpolyglutamate synthase/dihydrofolate synthase [Lacrimispora sp. NSJ-141]|uniref:tetrahydrofolate synthase n=1 Tax=Lientehia hominis TaxID=2897778 RepID=A0AAP2W6W0_9FIRM|nr:folylpolyglutamate synthase/dihydrofolate synthase family protein [Lientehia hominis]MCD2491713.1 bifunctional folylpolyglutamate synthase/dihydrofolate synthase [Lientehia hominis]
MDYTEAIDYIDQVTKKKNIVLGLSSMRELLSRLGNPQDDLSFIHIAGTNGKGSTLAFIASVCRAAGYRVGRYNSPSVFSYCEKIQINGVPIEETDVARLMTEVRTAADSMEADGLSCPTAFEIETAVSFLYFREQGCELVALETGMGGETDATNVVETTVCSVITSVSMDHMKFLGNTLEEIARVKGGIIKRGRPAVLCGQSSTVTEIIRGICREKGSPLRISCPEKVKIVETGADGTVFDYGSYRGVKIPLLGAYQVINASTALEVVEILKELGYDIEVSAVYEGMASVVWPGRFQKLLDKPVFVIDGAHNPEAAQRLRDSINLYFTNRRILYIMGILADKDYREITAITAPLAERIYTVTPGSPRALPAERLKACIEGQAETVGFHGTVEAKGSLSKAVEDSLSWAGEEDVILAFGSLSYLGELSNALKENIHD